MNGVSLVWPQRSRLANIWLTDEPTESYKLSVELHTIMKHLKECKARFLLHEGHTIMVLP